MSDWSGGTRIGDSSRAFNLRWARRTLCTSGVVIVVSDGWDRGDPATVRDEMARLQRSCHRLVWLNPLAGHPEYRPLAAGMAAAYPFIDDFLPMRDLSSLERLGDVLAGLPGDREGRPERRGRPRVHQPAPGRIAGRAPVSIRPGGMRAPTRSGGTRGRPSCRGRSHDGRSRDAAAGERRAGPPRVGGEAGVRTLMPTVRAWQRDGVATGRAVVVRTFGSAPRPEGASFLAAADGRIAGSVSGGAWRARSPRSARSRRDGVSRVVRYGIPDERAWDVGLACGGTVDVLVEPFVRPEVAAAAESDAAQAIAIPLPIDAPPPDFGSHATGAGAPPAAALVIGADGMVAAGTLGDAEADATLAAAAGRRLAGVARGWSSCALGPRRDRSSSRSSRHARDSS